ncbi:CYTH domain-containing protein [Candidatus Pantoea persica]|uniref:CYTH domain-containing protein n=1 Tax=Candidatus Pantoea persica TaxID=2518128 RepID=UPI00215DAB00|nr:inorganic triphosphatase [Candidatus Pantoea persica]MBA2816354.1 adenylate cyclase [Candidatus Pantoea persica]
MTIETELKFIATPDAASKLAQTLTAFPHQHQAARALSNTYFETDDNQLRRWDMGLRIRGVDGHYEMTLKTARKTLGGLHQRAEYNIDLTEAKLDIARLPDEVWPQGTDVAALQQRLQPLFSTHFQRETWLVQVGESKVEVVFDRGAVATETLSEDLFEVELELKSGQRSDMMTFAAQLIAMGGLRLGSLSKAARGYQLAQGNPARPLRPFPLLKAAPKATVEEGMIAAMSSTLSYWQYHEEVWLRGDASAQHSVVEALEALRQAFSLFGALVPRKASSDLRQKLTALEELLAEPVKDAQALSFSPLAVKTQLALTLWLVEAQWRRWIDARGQAKLDGSFKRFSDIMLSRIAADLKETFGDVQQANEYHDKATRLSRQLLAVHLLAGAYAPKAVTIWLAPWQQLQQAIAQNQDHWLKSLAGQAIRQPAFWLNSSTPR